MLLCVPKELDEHRHACALRITRIECARIYTHQLRTRHSLEDGGPHCKHLWIHFEKLVVAAQQEAVGGQTRCCSCCFQRLGLGGALARENVGEAPLVRVNVVGIREEHERLGIVRPVFRRARHRVCMFFFFEKRDKRQKVGVREEHERLGIVEAVFRRARHCGCVRC